ncbi:putative aminotransferase YugH [Methylacidimicrobium sp. AP8]|uniref:aminotransferase class I/II-fold pyridoxal phosphate-dependent enzyme n=1 Tax=Methylacidimicrobium sp. AP8 TaxID=2730359 RepID=UPI0018C033F5|nr:aminotransferase class I/II-fold pyridoxal phosphate-dependent enzyme [Methylacidimicrobium sp. AP8]CAB4243878.1 putative aminotransferase YugH [Methylacidimicrobium sp. AP8]
MRPAPEARGENILPFLPSGEQLVARHVRDLPRSGIRDFFDLVQSMEDVVSLGIGEPGEATPWSIREQAIFALESGKTGYTSNLGLLRLRRAISTYMERLTGVRYDPEAEILVTVGVSEALDCALRAILNPGERVLFAEPGYVAYSPGIVLSHGVPVGIPTQFEDGFRLRAEQVAEKAAPGVKALLLNSPANPTGSIVEADDLEKIAAIARKENWVVLSDEIYAELTYEKSHRSVAALPGMKDRTIVLNGLSKAFAMTGFRLGWACGPAHLIAAMVKIHQYAMLCAPIVSQEAGIEALERGAGEVEAMRRAYRRKRNYLRRALTSLGFPCHCPEGAFYLFPAVFPFGLSSQEFSLRLLREARVAVVPGTAFGPSGEGYLRCSFSPRMEDLEEAVGRMSWWMRKNFPRKSLAAEDRGGTG